MEWEIAWKIFGFILTGFVTLIWWNVRNASADLRALQARSSAHGIDLANYKTHVSESYATKNDLNVARLETNNSLDRLHGRIDEVGRDIKLILRGAKHDGAGN